MDRPERMAAADNGQKSGPGLVGSVEDPFRFPVGNGKVTRAMNDQVRNEEFCRLPGWIVFLQVLLQIVESSQPHLHDLPSAGVHDLEEASLAPGSALRVRVAADEITYAGPGHKAA